MDNDDTEYQFRLDKYLLHSVTDTDSVPELEPREYKIAPRLYSDDQLVREINNLMHQLKVYSRPSLSGFQSYRQQHVEHTHASHEREEKHELLEHHHVHDTYLLSTLQEFLVITIALLVKLERMHKKHVLLGNVNPYTFLYRKSRRACEPVDLGVVLSDKNVVRAEQQVYGPYIYLTTNLAAIPYTRYLAPELKESVRVYRLQRRLKDLITEATNRKNVNELCSNCLNY